MAARRKVLIVDDNVDSIKLASYLLEREQFEVHVASTGTDGWRVMRAVRPDVLVLDLRLPDIDGLQLVRWLRADPELNTGKEVAIIVLTGCERRELLVECQRLGVHYFLKKPVSSRTFLSAIRTSVAVLDKNTSLRELR